LGLKERKRQMRVFFGRINEVWVTTLTDLIELIWMDVSTCPNASEVEEKGNAGISNVPEIE
jgi:hypothetical protein